MLSKLFNAFDQLNQGKENPLREISVKRSQILISFDQPDVIFRKDFNVLDNLQGLGITDIGCIDNILYLSYRDLTEDYMVSESVDKNMTTLYDFITILRTILCQCPAMEYVIAKEYIKVYLDVPNLNIESLMGVNEVLGANGFLELNGPRPYILYIREFAEE